MPTTILSYNTKIKKLILDEKRHTLKVYMKDELCFIELSKAIDEYEYLSQTDEVAPETFELLDDINHLKMTFTGNIKDSLKFLTAYNIFGEDIYQTALTITDKLYADVHHECIHNLSQDLLNDCEDKPANNSSVASNNEYKDSNQVFNFFESIPSRSSFNISEEGNLSIKETQKTVSKKNPQKLLTYAVDEIQVDQSKTTIRVCIRSPVNFDRILGVLRKIYNIKNKYLAFPQVPFDTKYDKSTKIFIFKGDIKGVLQLLVSMSAMSLNTYNETMEVFKNKNVLKVKP